MPSKDFSSPCSTPVIQEDVQSPEHQVSQVRTTLFHSGASMVQSSRLKYHRKDRRSNTGDECTVAPIRSENALDMVG